MKINIQIDDQLLAEVEKLAEKRGQTISAVIEDALRQMMSRQAQIPLKLFTVSGKGLQPGVNLDELDDSL